MNFSFLLLFVFAAASNLVEVDDKTFKDVVISSGKFTLVDFYADWCRHCMKLMPTIEQLADLYADVPEIQIVKIDGDEEGRKMSKKYKVPGFPTLLLFHGDDKPVEFEGSRDLESISNFVQHVSGITLRGSESEDTEEGDDNFGGVSKIIQVNDNSFQDDVLRANHKTLVAFVAPWCKYCQKLKPIWNRLANRIFSEDGETVRFAEVDLSDSNKAHVEHIVGQFGISSMPTILYFDPSKVDEDGLRRPIPYTGDRELEPLLSFVNENAGLSRNTTGELTADAGRIKHLDEAIRNVTSETSEHVIGVIEALKEDVSRFGRDALVEQEQIWFRDDVSMLPYYAKVAVKLASGDVDFVTRELARMEKILSKNARDLESTARDYMQKRVNILKAHIGK
ncbi:hypothetical protein JCM33374_g4296 [Metschnikowia sp. JCM 33374]|nr:hypothetical protein JCM33374_g4296 [Metschnikowia sp. JCM 33374]